MLFVCLFVFFFFCCLAIIILFFFPYDHLKQRANSTVGLLEVELFTHREIHDQLVTIVGIYRTGTFSQVDVDFVEYLKLLTGIIF